jgi:predicted acyltransferase
MYTTIEPSPATAAAHSAGHASRLVSLDVFRGLTIAAMLLVNNPGSWSHVYAPLRHAPWHGWTLTDLVFPFFLFIVGVAIPLSLGKRSSGEHQPRRGLLGHIWLRALTIFLIGQLLVATPSSNTPLPDGHILLKTFRVLGYIICYGGIVALLVPWPWKRASLWLPPIVCVAFYLLLIVMHYLNQHALGSGLPPDFRFGGGMFNPTRLRIPGVLQRIGICYGVAASIALYGGWKTAAAGILLLCGAYSALMLGVKMPGHTTGSLTESDNLARIIDEAVFDKYAIGPDGNRQIVYRHTYSAYPDNEGLLSTLPAIATTLIGVLVGWWLRASRAPADKCVALLAMGVLVTIAGQLLDWWLMPINKNLWTPSFAVFTAGLAMLTLGTIYWAVDLKRWTWWTLPLVIFGMNSIAAFVFKSWVPRFAAMVKNPNMPDGLTKFVKDRLADALQAGASFLPALDTPYDASLAYAIVFVLAVLVLLSVMYVCRIFVKA